MRRELPVATAVLLTIATYAQRGDELIVYSVKGDVTAVYKNSETPVKIGKVLYPGMILRTGDDAALTMLCTRGKAISVNKKGNYPVTKWKDSCRSESRTVTSNYFKYVWGQLYAYSPENKEEMRKRNEMAVSRGEPVGTVRSKRKGKLSISKGLDTVYYDGRSFPLSWNLTHYRGLFHFKLFDAAGRKLLFQDSLRSNFIQLDSLEHLMEKGKKYRWAVAAKGYPVTAKKTIYCIGPEETAKKVTVFSIPLPLHEDSAAACFRTAFLLEQHHFLAEAFEWYKKAASQDPEMELYRDQLIRFRNEYWIR